MKKYDSYKDSGIEVLGKVPSSWKKSKFKFQHFEIDERVGEDSSEYDLLSLTKKGIILRDIESGKGKFPESFETYKKVKKNDLIFCLYDIEETPRTVGLSELNGMITGSYKIFNSKDVITKFTYYTFLVIDNVKGLKPYYTGLRNVVRPETFKSLPFFIPSLSEQQQIVSFLDTKTSLIDSLIDKTKKKIELLKEKRTSLINEIVTKGLNTNEEMKYSGVGWIGDIPSHWSVSRVKKYFKERNEKVSDLEYDPLSVTKNGIVPQLDNVSKSDNHNDRKRVSKNDIVINSRSDRKGSSGMSEYNGSVSLINIVLRPISINPKYSEFLFKSKSFIEEFFRNGKGIHWDLWSTRYSELQNIKIPYPSIKEQQQIVEYLDEQTQLIDNTISIEEKRIKLLKEYRQSLISEVVTGKRKVV